MTSERQNIHTILIICYRFHINDSTIILALRFTFIKHPRSYIDGVSNENRIQMLDTFIIQIGYCLTTHIGHGNANCK